ncbi:fluoride efflux transporter CrcB [Motiliproteus sediminis]|uniref:fluoride efflux transporter CrcB n=1 Tax=Motiliproteus sediminis TaxID=1468178 RepID=UPI001AF00C78|nr:fluoride efflux transporter CrcB [Motiliproteus sediminis]
MLQLLFIALGGAVGALGRFWVGSVLIRNPDHVIPLGTLTVNVLGSALMGVCYVLILEKAQLPPEMRPLLMVGFLGAFTTFSTFSLETLTMIQQGHMLAAVIYISLSVICCVAAAAAGCALTRAVF